MNITLLLDMAAEAGPDRIAVGPRSEGRTYAWLADRARRLAGRLRADGTQRVLYTGTASPVLPVALFGAAGAGAAFAPLSYRLADDRLRALVEGLAPALLVCDPGTEGRVTGIPGIEVVGTDALLADLEGRVPSEEPAPDDPEGVAVLLPTSGTSGTPKVAVLRHRHLAGYVLGSVEFLAAGEDEAGLVSVPPYHIAGISALLTSVYGGRRIVQLPTFEPEAWVEAVRAESVTHAMTVPTMLTRILDVVDAGDGTPGEPALPSLRHLSYGGGRMPGPVIERALARLPHVAFVNAYGLTETSSSIAVLGPDDHRLAHASADPVVRARLGSVGRPLPTVEITVRDASGAVLPPGAKGEIWVRGEQVSGEYAGREGADDGGWFATRDGGWFDADGYLFVEGRMDDVIVRGGENMSPGEIEDVLLAHPAVAEAVVLGLPDEEWGEVVAAAVVLHPGAVASTDQLADHVAAKLRSSRRPSVVEVRDALPYNDAGKVLRRQVRAELVERTPA